MTDRAAGVMSSCMIAMESLSLVLRSRFVIEGRLESNRYSWCCDSALVAPARCFFVLCSSRTNLPQRIVLKDCIVSRVNGVQKSIQLCVGLVRLYPLWDNIFELLLHLANVLFGCDYLDGPYVFLRYATIAVA